MVISISVYPETVAVGPLPPPYTLPETMDASMSISVFPSKIPAFPPPYTSAPTVDPLEIFTVEFPLTAALFPVAAEVPSPPPYTLSVIVEAFIITSVFPVINVLSPFPPPYTFPTVAPFVHSTYV